jgi:hypothetical protein
VLAFLDDDAVADPSWLSVLADAYASEMVLGVGGAVDPLWTSPRPAWFPVEFDWVVGCTYRGLPDRSAPVRNLIGASMSIRREVFAEVGGFRSGVGRVGTRPLGCEETELCIRALKRWPEASFRLEPAARVRHLVPAERGTWRYFRARCFAEGLSKALVARLVGADCGLASERSYALRALPAGVLRGIHESSQGDPMGLARAGAILAGLLFTVAGFFYGTLRSTPDPELHTVRAEALRDRCVA